jgi:hypothetical protein
MAKQGVTRKYTKIQRILGDGTFVLAMSEGTHGSRHVAGKVAEHRDTMEIIPVRKGWKN